MERTIVLQYKINDDSDGTFEVQALEFDGVPQNIFVYSQLIKAMYYDYLVSCLFIGHQYG